MPKRMYAETSSYAGFDAGASWVEAQKRGFNRLRGSVATPHGFVRVWGGTRAIMWYGKGRRSWGKTAPRVTRLYFIYRGRTHVRSFDRLLSLDGVLRQAHRFTRDVVG